MMNSIRVIFLDFDGVLNSHAYIATLKNVVGVVGLDPAAVARLNRLIETKAEVVVSSSWRINRSLPQLREALVEKGFVGTVRGMTPRWLSKSPGGLYSADCRGQEIQSWLDAAPNYGITVSSFCILDDDSDMAHLADRHIKTLFATGLLDEHVDRAIEMLHKPMPLIVTPNAEDIARIEDP